MAKDKRTNIDLQSTTQKTKDRATCTLLRTRENLISFGMVAFPAELALNNNHSLTHSRSLEKQQKHRSVSAVRESIYNSIVLRELSYKSIYILYYIKNRLIGFLVFNATFSNISAIAWRPYQK